MKRLLFIAISIIYFFTAASQTILKGTAVKVYDGDTFTLLTSEGTEYKIRVVGIDAPEIKQEFGTEARDYARSLIANKLVTVYCEHGETYGRKLGIVITHDGLHFNYEMVVNGYAWHYAYYNKDKFLKSAQIAAQNNYLGLWNYPNPIAPWTWRKQN